MFPEKDNQVNHHLLRRWLEKSAKGLLKLNMQNLIIQKIRKHYRHSQIYMTTFKEGGFLSLNKKSPNCVRGKFICGENGIRTHEALLELTHFPGVRLRPLGHLSLKGLSELRRKLQKKTVPQSKYNKRETILIFPH